MDFCGSAIVHRNSDGRELICYTPAGAHTCSTRQLNDANVTSYAETEYTGGAWNYYGKTAAHHGWVGCVMLVLACEIWCDLQPI